MTRTLYRSLDVSVSLPFPKQTEQQSQIQLDVLSQQQLPGTDYQQQQGQSGEGAKPVQVYQRRLIPLLFVAFCLCALIIGLIIYGHQHLQSPSTGNKLADNGKTIKTNTYYVTLLLLFLKKKTLSVL